PRRRRDSPRAPIARTEAERRGDPGAGLAARRRTPARRAPPPAARHDMRGCDVRGRPAREGCALATNTATAGGPIDATAEWAALQAHRRAVGDAHLRELFAADPGRGERMTLAVGDLYLDYSKHRLTSETLRLLVALAERAGLP